MDTTAVPDAAARRRFQLIPDDEFEARKPPEYLIDGILPMGAEAKLVGDSGVGKSFVAEDMAFCVATGRLFLGKFAVKKGLVVYIAAEGAGGFAKRVRAYKRHHGIEGRAGVHFVDAAVQMDGRASEQVTELLQEIRTLPQPPLLIVIDTQNRCMEGKDENAPADMGEFLAAVSRIREETGAAVLVVHHTGWKRGKQPGHERGHSSQRGATDTTMLVEKEAGAALATGGPITLKCLKQKDDAEFADITIKTTVMNLGTDENGKEHSSLVLEVADGATSAASESRVDLHDPTQKRPEYFEHETHITMILLRDGPLRAAELRAAVPDIPERTFYGTLKRLCEKRGVVVKGDDDRYDLIANVSASPGSGSLRALLEGLSKQRLDYTYHNARGGIGLVIRRADWTWYEAEAAA